MSLPRIDPKTVKPGDRITVMVAGRPYETEISATGTHRFVEDPDNALVKRLRDRSDGLGPRPEGDVADLNEMAMLYHVGEFTQREYAEMNMALGYSLGGFQELSSFEDMDIDNPLEEAGVEYDTNDVVSVDLTLTRSAGIAVLAMLDVGRQDLSRGSDVTHEAREEARTFIEKLRAIVEDEE